MQKFTGLSFQTVQYILSDLIYDRSLYVKGRQQPDISSQPFIPLSDGSLALSNWLVIHTNPEKAIWSLLNIKRPNLHSKLRNLKEDTWLRDLTTTAKELALEIFGPIKYSGGDIDCILVDREDRFILLCQLKWLQPPDRLKEVALACQEVSKGIEQAMRAHKWVCENGNSLATRLKITPVDFKSFTIRSCVMTKSFFGKGRANNPEFPVLSERLFRWVLCSPHRKSLRCLWGVAAAKRYQPKINKHYLEGDIKTSFGDYNFTLKRGGLVSLDNWNPSTDIDFEDL